VRPPVVPDPGLHRAFERLQYFGIAFVPVAWLLFTLSYTGYDEFVTRRVVAALSVLPVATVVLVWTNRFHGLVWRYAEVTVVGGVPVEQHLPGPWFLVNLVYAYLLVLTGAGLLLGLVSVSDYLYADQSGLLVVGTVVPLLANLVSVTGYVLLPGLDVTPFGFTVTGLTFGYALFDRRLFDLVPATRRLGRDAAIADLDDGVLILDADYRVVYCNPTAGEILGRDLGDVLGERSTAFFDEAELEGLVPT